jgi:hypothetical protein
MSVSNQWTRLLAFSCLCLSLPKSTGCAIQDGHAKNVAALAGDYFRGDNGACLQFSMDDRGEFSFAWQTDDAQSGRYFGRADVIGGQLVLRANGLLAEAALAEFADKGQIIIRHSVELPKTKRAVPQRSLSFLPITWDSRTYLLTEREAIRFCNAVNLGLEPRRQSLTGSFFLRAKVTRASLIGVEHPIVGSARGLPNVPSQLQSLLLKTPVGGKITGVIDSAHANANLGTNDGVRKDMKLYLAREKKTGSGLERAGIVGVTAVAAESCTVEIDDSQFFLGPLGEAQIVLSRIPSSVLNSGELLIPP